MYCFQHGLPTRNPGTWLPQLSQPWCGNATCALLASDIWPPLLERAATALRGQRRENWLRRVQMECEACKQERRRRYCVLPASGEDAERHLQEPFTSAAFVHPFRHPSYHATQLRAIIFAKSKHRRVHWITAYDKPKTGALSTSSDQRVLRQERWLEFHDRFTAGIPGLLPLVLDLPVRFTDSIGKKAREAGVFKHTRGIVRGWELEPEEEERLSQTEEPEVVLQKRPKTLYIEVPSAAGKMKPTHGKCMYALKVQCKQWSLDKSGNISITRFGFPIVPDFGGTAHAYCGTTMEAAMGDLLPWSKKPQMADLLKAYIIKSRVREADKLLLAQPYSPQLFRQGLLPGPQLLLDVLTGNKSEAEAKAAWKKWQKENKDSTPNGSWLSVLELPCRRCTDNNPLGTEVLKAVSGFGTDVLPRDVWQNVVSRGQDLICWACRRDVGDASTQNFICCEGCGIVQPLTDFETQEKKRWHSLDNSSILCKSCTGAGGRRVDGEMVQCNGDLCKGQQLPEYHFIKRYLDDWRAKELVVSVRCARCWIRSSECNRSSEAK